MNHRKCQKSHSGIGSSHQGLGQARILARRLYKERQNLKKALPFKIFRNDLKTF